MNVSDEYIANHFAVEFPPVDRRPLPRRIEEYNNAIKTMIDYAELPETMSYYYPKYCVFYRGHANCEWELLPSLVRGGCSDTMIARERLIFPKLKAILESAGYGRYRAAQFNEELFYMGVGRHLGLKSRLLDWTTDLKVAMEFFLLEEEFIEVDGALWIMFVPHCIHPFENGSPFDINDSEIHLLRESNYMPEDESIMNYKAGVRRRLNQYGLFSVTSESIMKTPLNEMPSRRGIVFKKMSVPVLMKRELMSERSENFQQWYLGETPEDVEIEIKKLNSSLI